MPPAADFLSRHRAAALALLASAALHAAVLVGVPQPVAAFDDDDGPVYSATLDAASAGPAPAAARAASRPRRTRTLLPRSRIAPMPALPEPQALAALAPDPVLAPAPSQPAPAAPAANPEPPPAPEKLALAQPATPPKPPEPEPFPVEALPARMTIDYHLTSAFADGHATYRWDRDGDSYTINAEAEAEGFFTLFLEGRIVQESHGTVTAAGLRPDRFSESKPGGPPEGLEFDWPGRQVTFDRNGEKKTSPLADNTLDWLSMIFQLAHLPPTAESFDMQVFTQRRMYRFRLKVLGVEEIEIPLGRVNALHLRHVDPDNDKEVVDVWLGVDQHYLPVKLRFPAARNRLVVEQVATRVTSR